MVTTRGSRQNVKPTAKPATKPTAKPAEIPTTPVINLVEEDDGDVTESPISVLEDKEEPLECRIEHATSAACQVITEEMIKEEELLMKQRMEEDKTDVKPPQVIQETPAPALMNKLDELLHKTNLYTKFLEEQMEESKKEKEHAKPGRKRKGLPDNGKAAKKRQLSADYEDADEENSDPLTEEERTRRMQLEIAPLLTGGFLKPFQLKGIKWLISLWKNGLNGILADQMGLGKTIQTIGFLAHLMGNKVEGPFLVCAPLSTLFNWKREIERWCPSMKSLLYHGTKQERAKLRKEYIPRNKPIITTLVTSYEVVISDSNALKKCGWKYVIVDEGHRLKNHECKLFKELRKLNAENALLLTGTPLQNSLPELWSLLNFILPEVFSSLSEFQSWFDFSGQVSGSGMSEVVAKLHAILRPFLLRRMKSEVEKMLPKKKEIILYAKMSETQKVFNQHLVSKTLEEYLEEKKSYPGTTLKKKLNNICMQLRKNCNHPDLLQSQFENTYDFAPVEKYLSDCGKLKLLDRLLLHLKNGGHRVLIFSQMTRMLDILEYYLAETNRTCFRLDGNVKQDERRQRIQSFEKGEGFIFLLSTRAGGLGINLTSADTAIIYDSDWNPQMDLQAMDRCHRIGQSRPVHVYRLATSHSVECRMLKVATSKLQLENLVIDKGQFRLEKDHKSAAAVDLEEEMLAVLKDVRTEEEEYVQSSDISEENLCRVMDRSDMEDEYGGEALPLKGAGWEVVLVKGGGQSMLSSIEGYRKP